MDVGVVLEAVDKLGWKIKAIIVVDKNVRYIRAKLVKLVKQEPIRHSVVFVKVVDPNYNNLLVSVYNVVNTIDFII